MRNVKGVLIGFFFGVWLAYFMLYFVGELNSGYGEREWRDNEIGQVISLLGEIRDNTR